MLRRLACRLLEGVGMLLLVTPVLVHPLAGVLSAYGMGLAPITRQAQADAGRRPLSEPLLEQLAPIFAQLERTPTQPVQLERDPLVIVQ